MNNILDRILTCKDDEIDQIVSEELEKLNETSIKTTELGLTSALQYLQPHHGFINENTKIKYSNFSMITYSMRTTDYFYEFARFVRKYGIKNNNMLVIAIENFINRYFLLLAYSKDVRDDYFYELTWQKSISDEEYFQRLDALELGTLKGKGIAMCTERAAMAQNLLAFFGFDVYYCVGVINNNENVEQHAFNIARAKNEWRLLDYTLPVPIIKNEQIVDYAPFEGEIAFSEFEDVLNNDLEKTFSSYEFHKNGSKYNKVATSKIRTYLVGHLDFGEKNLDGYKRN